MTSRVPRAAEAILLCIAPAFAATITVPTDFPLIQDAIGYAADGDSVLILPGTYLQNFSFEGKGITVTGSDPSDWAVVENTVIDAEGNRSVVGFRDWEQRSSVLAGLTLTGGTGSIYDVGPMGGKSVAGGGIFCDRWTRPVIRSCLVSGNEAIGETAYGGGVFCHEHSSPLLVDTRIENNESVDRGGGVGARSASPLMLRCSVADNVALIYGGGGYFADPATNFRAAILRCEIDRNQAIAGGGLCVVGRTLVIVNSEIRDNVALSDSGALSFTGDGRALLYGTLIDGNNAERDGGAISCTSSGTMYAENCTIINNTAGDDGSAIMAYHSSYPVLRNTILWGNGPDPLFVGGDASITATYCNIEGGWPGDGNIDSDPLFADRYHGFEHLLSTDSPCIDSGDPAILDAIYDTDPRWPGGHVDGPRSDMGMYSGIGNGLWLR